MKLTIRANFKTSGQKSFGISNLRILTSNCPKQNCTLVSQELTNNQITSDKRWVLQDWFEKATSPINLRTCLSVTHVFGTGTRIMRDFVNLKNHNKVRISFKIQTTGPWPEKSYFVITINDVIVKAIVANSFEHFTTCPGQTTNTIRNYYLDVDHRDTYLEFIVTTKSAGENSGFTVRDFVLYTYEDQQFQGLVKSDFNSIAFLQSTIKDWIIVGQFGSSKVTKCGRFNLFGGSSVFGKGTTARKTFTNLPPHQFIYLTFELHIIDSWDYEELNVFIDNQFVSHSTNTLSWAGVRNICGEFWEEEPQLVKIIFPHTNNQAEVILQDTLNQAQNDESWGIKSFHLAVGTFDIEDRNQICIEKEPTCTTIYSECSFKGDSLEVCSGILDRDQSSWKVPIKSVKIPKGQNLHILRGPSYDSTQECIK